MDVNEALQRKIKSGNKYNRYFEKVNCKSSFVGTGNTSFGMQQMKQVSKQYQHQTAELAKQLRKPTISQTVSSIYEFLYDHLQYQLDGYDQQLRSPACSWQQRSVGIDCKSYSVFASGILLNLGIKHYFRKIKQPGYNPNAWSHVYVIVPDGENYFVIDGTLHENIEVPYSEKEDLLMEAKLNYYALNAPNVAAGQTQDRDGDIEKLKGFTIALNALEKVGVSPQKTLQISQLVKNAYFRYNTFDFPFGLISDSILNVNGTYIDLGISNDFLGSTTPITTTIAGIDLDMFTNNTTDQTTAGSGITGALSTLAVDPSGISAIIGTISSLLPLDEIMANVTNVLKYGLSSWGATTSPEGIQGKINELAGFASKALGNSDPGNGLTQFNMELKKLKTYYTHLRQNHAKATSTQKAYDLMIQSLDGYITMEAEIISKLKAQGYLFEVTSAIAKGVTNIFTDTTGHDVGTDAHNKATPFSTTYNVYTLTQSPQSPVVNQQQVQYNADGTIKPPTSSSNIGKILGYGGAIAMAGFLVMPMLNKKK